MQQVNSETLQRLQTIIDEASSILQHLTLKEDDQENDFKIYFMKNLSKISSKTMTKLMGEIDNELLAADICWLFADCIVEVLKINNQQTNHFNGMIDVDEDLKSANFNTVDLKAYLETQMNSHCVMKLFVNEIKTKPFLQTVGQDHWFVVIVQEENVILAEWSPDETHVWDSMEKPVFVSWMIKMIQGKTMDRFYKKKATRVVKIQTYGRHSLTRQTIDNFLR